MAAYIENRKQIDIIEPNAKSCSFVLEQEEITLQDSKQVKIDSATYRHYDSS